MWEGSDAELIEKMLRFYPSIDPEPILDSTYNTGRFWKGSSRNVWSMDIDPKYEPMIVADNRVMDGVPSNKFGTVVYDPPHVGPQGRGIQRNPALGSSPQYAGPGAHLWPPGLQESRHSSFPKPN